MNIFGVGKYGPSALAYAFILTFSSSVGQTFFISLFAAEIQNELKLTHGSFGMLYTCSTFASAVIFVWLGKFADKYDLLCLGVFTLLGLVLCTFLVSIAQDIIILGLAIFGIRLLGQGQLGHVAVTAMGRWYSSHRGKAVSVASIGFAVGEAVFPIIVSFCFMFFTWREVWLGTSVILAVFICPLILLLSFCIRKRLVNSPQYNASFTRTTKVRSWTRADVLQDKRFYIILPGLFLSPFIITGILFHQIHLVEIKSWTLSNFAACYSLYALSATTCSILSGWMTDRVGAVRLLGFYLLPLALGVGLLAVSNSIIIAPIFMILIGMTAGSGTVIFGAIWAELYGVDFLGEIRALSITIMVIATSISPGLMGIFIDLGVELERQFSILACCTVFCALALIKFTPDLYSCSIFDKNLRI